MSFCEGCRCDHPEMGVEEYVIPNSLDPTAPYRVMLCKTCRAMMEQLEILISKHEKGVGEVMREITNWKGCLPS